MCLKIPLSPFSSSQDMRMYLKELFSCPQPFLNTEKEQIEMAEFLQNSCLQILSAGELLPVEMLLCYSILSHHIDVPKNDMIEKYKNQFDEMYFACRSDQLEHFVMNVLVTICEFVNGNFKEGIKTYLQRLFTSDTRTITQDYSWAFYYNIFLKTGNVPLEIILESIEDLLKWENYEQLNPIQRRSIFVWSLHEVWHIDAYFNNPKWLKLYEPLKMLSDELLSRNMLEEQMYVHFFTYHMYGNHIHTQEQWKRFTTDFDEPESKAFKKYALDVQLPLAKESVSNGRKKIVVIKDRIVNNSVFQVEYALFSDLMKNDNFTKEYELSVLSMTYYDKSEDGKREVGLLRELGIKVVSPGNEVHANGLFYYNHLRKAELIREYILYENIDILLLDASCFDISNFLLATRSAPRQIFWSHGNFVYDVDGIDKKISHFPSQSEFNFEVFTVNVNMTEYTPEMQMKEVNDIRSCFSEDIFILGTIGRLIKIDDDEYLKSVARIMEHNPNTIYLACGAGNEDSIRHKVRALGIEERFYFQGHINPHTYAYVIDLWLEPFALSSGESLNEYMHKGRQFIMLWKEWTPDQRTSEDYDDYQKYIWPATIDEYCDLSNNLIQNKQLRAYIQGKLTDSMKNQKNDFVHFLTVLED